MIQMQFSYAGFNTAQATIPGNPYSALGTQDTADVLNAERGRTTHREDQLHRLYNRRTQSPRSRTPTNPTVFFEEDYPTPRAPPQTLPGANAPAVATPAAAPAPPAPTSSGATLPLAAAPAPAGEPLARPSSIVAVLDDCA